MFTVKEVSQRLNCSLSTVYNNITAGRLKAYRVGVGNRGLRVSEEQLEEFLERSLDSAEEDREPPLKHLR